MIAKLTENTPLGQQWGDCASRDDLAEQCVRLIGRHGVHYLAAPSSQQTTMQDEQNGQRVVQRSVCQTQQTASTRRPSRSTSLLKNVSPKRVQLILVLSSIMKSKISNLLKQQQSNSNFFPRFCWADGKNVANYCAADEKASARFASSDQAANRL